LHHRRQPLEITVKYFGGAGSPLIYIRYSSTEYAQPVKTINLEVYDRECLLRPHRTNATHSDRRPHEVTVDIVNRAERHAEAKHALRGGEPAYVFSSADSRCQTIIVTGSDGCFREPDGGTPIYAQCGYRDDEPWYDRTTEYCCKDHGGIRSGYYTPNGPLMLYDY
jgi:hypothetical protein